MIIKLVTSVVLTSLTFSAIAADSYEQSDAELARELANPNTALASLNLRTQYRMFKGSLPDANDQDNTTLLFQPVLPFPFENGKILYVRPAIPVIIDQPVFDSHSMDFDSHFGLGDASIDLQYGTTTESGLLWSFGATATLPTATKSELGGNRWGLGPGIQLGQLSSKSVIGTFINHQWDIGGSGEQHIDITTMQIFGIFLPGGGWNVGSSPIMSYNHEINESTIPLNFTVGKTVRLNGRPVKVSVELNYYVKQPDQFGPEWMIGFNLSPVVKNVMADWF